MEKRMTKTNRERMDHGTKENSDRRIEHQMRAIQRREKRKAEKK